AVVEAPAVTLAGHLPVAAQAARESPPEAHLGPLPPTGDGGGSDGGFGRGAHPKLTPRVIPPAQEPILMDGELPRRGNRGKEILGADATGGVRACRQGLPAAVVGGDGREKPPV